MRVSVNLATRPFVELRPLFARLRIAMVVLAVLAIGLFIGLRVMSKRVNAAESQMRELKVQTSVLDNERHERTRVLRTRQRRLTRNCERRERQILQRAVRNNEQTLSR